MTLTALVAGAIWLFWGKEIERQWRSALSNHAAKKSETNNPTQKKTPTQKKEKELVRDSRQAVASREWLKARTGIEGLIELQAEDSRAEINKASARVDARWLELLTKSGVRPLSGSKAK